MSKRCFFKLKERTFSITTTGLDDVTLGLIGSIEEPALIISAASAGGLRLQLEDAGKPPGCCCGDAGLPESPWHSADHVDHYWFPFSF